MSTFQFTYMAEIPVLVTAGRQKYRAATRNDEGQPSVMGIRNIEIDETEVIRNGELLEITDLINYVYECYYGDLKQAAEEQE